MSKKNPFDIKANDELKTIETTTIGSSIKIPKYPDTKKKWKKKDYTQDQIKELLNGYIEVSKHLWADIPTGSHIRYFKKDGTFVRGGFITNHWLNKEGKQFIHIANSFKKNSVGYATWPMAHESVEKIFKKPDTKSGIEMDVVRSKTAEIIGQINKLVDVVKEQKNRIDLQEAEIKKLYTIVKRIAQKQIKQPQ
jgi:hypothetical protein